MADTVRSVLRYAQRQRDAVRSNLAGAAAGDPDAIHDMRVAIRRLRSTLRTFRGLWPRQPGERLRAELKWLADRLGPVRDGQVTAAALQEAIDAEPPELVVGPVAARLRQKLAAVTLSAREQLREVLNGDRVHGVLTELDALLDQPRPTRPGWVRRRARKAVRRADRRLDRARSDEALHEARKAYKRGRYAAEALGNKPARKLAKRVGQLQDVLGAQHDSVVIRQLLREQGMRAHTEGENAFTYGLLHARQQAEAARTMEGLGSARRKVRRASRAKWLG
jgi:CHAD domain-containing protein